MKVTFDRYLSFRQQQQAEILWLDGVYLDLIHRTQLFHTELYALYDFYVAVYYDPATEDPVFLRAFRNTEFLEPYLSLISLDGILDAPDHGRKERL